VKSFKSEGKGKVDALYNIQSRLNDSIVEQPTRRKFEQNVK